MKRTLGLVLSLMVALTIFVCTSVTVSAETGNVLNFVLNDDGVSYSVIGYSTDATEIVIPSTYNDLPVTSVGNSAFYDADNVTVITIADTVTSIGNTAFYDCHNLSSLKLPDSVTSIGAYAFFGCDNLTITASCDSCVVEYAKNEAVKLDLQHKFKQEGTVITEPTYKTEGTMSYECSVCGVEKYESILKLIPPTLELIDGQWVCFSGDTVLTDYTGLAEYEGSYLYLENSVITSDYTGLAFYCDDWYYMESGILNWNYTGLTNYYDVWYYVENGFLNWNYTGLTNYYDVWYYVENGVLNWNYTGLTNYYDVWYYVENGILNWNYTGLTNYYDVWYYVENGVLNWNYTGLTNYYDVWYYVENGILNWSYTGLTNYYDVWYYVENGILNWSYTGLTNYYDVWYYVENGILNWNYTGLTNYYDVWYYVENGILNWNYTGITNYYDVWYYVENGILNWNRETLAYAYNTWFYIENGQINWNGNTVVYYYGIWYYVNGGCVDWNYDGVWYEYGVLYFIENGAVTLIAQPETKEEILAFYQNAMKNVVASCNAGYSHKMWEDITQVDYGNTNLSQSIKNIIKDMGVSEEEAEKYSYSIGSDDARDNIALANCSPDSVQAATIEEKGGNYIITIVMKDQFDPKKTDTDGISVMSNNIMYGDDLEAEVKEDLSSIMMNPKIDCTYSNYTIVAEITKNGELVSVKHSSNVYTDIEVTANGIGKMNVGLGMNLYEEFTDFIY